MDHRPCSVPVDLGFLCLNFLFYHFAVCFRQRVGRSEGLKRVYSVNVYIICVTWFPLLFVLVA